jgi:hypothetical protein
MSIWVIMPMDTLGFGERKGTTALDLKILCERYELHEVRFRAYFDHRTDTECISHKIRRPGPNASTRYGCEKKKMEIAYISPPKQLLMQTS